MNLNTLTSGIITTKFGVRPALMCAAKKDLSKHSVVRIVSDTASGWIGITYGQLISGAKCQAGSKTLIGNEALAAMLNLQDGAFDLIQIDSRLLSEDLVNPIGIKIEELLDGINAHPDSSLLDIIQQCKKVDESSLVFVQPDATPKLRKNKRTGELSILKPGDLDEDLGPDDEEWDLGEEGVFEELERQARGEQKDETASVPESQTAAPISKDATKENNLAVAQVPEAPVGKTNFTLPNMQTDAEPEFFHVNQAQSAAQSSAAQDEQLFEGVPPSSEMDKAFANIKQKTAELTPPGSKFVIVNDDEAASKRIPEGEPRPQRQMLRDDLRAELHEFVRNKFGVEGKKFFEEVDIQKSESYQASIVLRDLEKALERGKDEKEPEAVEKGNSKAEPKNTLLQEGLDHGLAVASWLKQQAQSGTAKGRFKSIDDNEVESSRNIFVEKVRKESEVDKKQFTAREEKETDIQAAILKDKKMRQTIITVATVCVVISGVALMMYSAERQSSMEEATHKLTSGDIAGAKASFEKIIKLQPENWEAFMKHAATVPNDYAAQVNDYKQVLVIKPDEIAAALGLTKAYYELKDYKHAISAADKAYAIDHSYMGPLEIKGQSLIRLGKYDEAIKVFKLAMEKPSERDAELNYLVATCYRSMGNTDGEIEYLQKSLQNDPSNAKNYEALAKALLSQNKLDAAKGALEKAISHNGGDSQLHFELAKVYLKLNATSGAIDELSKAIERGLANAETLGMRAELYVKKSQFGPAKADIDQALSLSPNNKTLLKLQSQTERQLAIEKSRVGTRQIVSTDEAETPLSAQDLQGDYVAKAYELMRQGRSGYAAKLCRHAIQLNPSDLRARRYLANALYNTGDYVESSNQFAAVAAVQALSMDEYFLYGKALVKAKRVEQAIKVLEPIVVQQPTFSKARVQLIKAYALAGFNDHVRSQCQEGMQRAATKDEYAEFKSLMP